MILLDGVLPLDRAVFVSVDGARKIWTAIGGTLVTFVLPLPADFWNVMLDVTIIGTIIGDAGPLDLPPTDLGITGALPLPDDTWFPITDELIGDADWSTQNRKINDLLAGRA